MRSHRVILTHPYNQRHVLARVRLLGFAVTLAIVAYGLWRLDLSAVADALRQADYRVIPFSAGATLGSYLLRTARWRLILAPSQRLSIRTLYPPLMIGFMANNLLPARMGELVRAYSLNRAAETPKTLALSTVLLERVFDGLTLVAILAALAAVGALPAGGGALAYVAGAIFVVATIGAWLVITNESLALRLLRVLTAPFPDALADLAEQKAQSFTKGLQSLRRPGTLLQIAVLSVIVWSCETLSYYVLLLGFGLPSALSAAFFMTVVVNLGIMVPSAPGYVGTFEGAGIAALAPYGMPTESALAVAIVAHGVQWLLVTGIGLALLARTGLSLRRVQAVERG
jgi:uncharacterized protein (TIRG00374 family)